jgi:hypothetical protein
MKIRMSRNDFLVLLTEIISVNICPLHKFSVFNTESLKEMVYFFNMATMVDVLMTCTFMNDTHDFVMSIVYKDRRLKLVFEGGYLEILEGVSECLTPLHNVFGNSSLECYF